MKSKEFCIGFSIQVRERTFNLLVAEDKRFGWVIVALFEGETEVLEESIYIGKKFKKEKTLMKLEKRVDQLEKNYQESGASPNIIRLFKQSKRIVASL